MGSGIASSWLRHVGLGPARRSGPGAGAEDGGYGGSGTVNGVRARGTTRARHRAPGTARPGHGPGTGPGTVGETRRIVGVFYVVGWRFERGGIIWIVNCVTLCCGGFADCFGYVGGGRRVKGWGEGEGVKKGKKAPHKGASKIGIGRARSTQLSLV